MELLGSRGEKRLPSRLNVAIAISEMMIFEAHNDHHCWSIFSNLNAAIAIAEMFLPFRFWDGPYYFPPNLLIF